MHRVPQSKKIGDAIRVIDKPRPKDYNTIRFSPPCGASSYERLQLTSEKWLAASVTPAGAACPGGCHSVFAAIQGRVAQRWPSLGVLPQGGGNAF
jgi:hypothetical protein